MNAAKQILSRMIDELPDEMMLEIITYVAFRRHLQENIVFNDLESASGSSIDFWNNPIDDEVWNNV